MNYEKFLANAECALNDCREIARVLRYQEMYDVGATLTEWWARLQSIVTGEDDFPDPRRLFMRLARLRDDAACADEQSAEVEDD